jgi:hypothetical protein
LILPEAEIFKHVAAIGRADIATNGVVQTLNHRTAKAFVEVVQGLISPARFFGQSKCAA